MRGLYLLWVPILALTLLSPAQAGNSTSASQHHDETSDVNVQAKPGRSHTVDGVVISCEAGTRFRQSKRSAQGWHNAGCYEKFGDQVVGTLVVWPTAGAEHTITNYENGKKNGFETKYFANGNKQSTAQYINNIERGPFEIWYENGKLAEKGTHGESGLDGLHQAWLSSGVLIEEGNYTNGAPDGYFTLYNENGIIVTTANYTHGNKNGVETKYFENGKVWSSTQYIDNIKRGPFEIWYENGQPAEKGTHGESGLDGLHQVGLPSGVLVEEGNYINGVLDGAMKRWDTQGHLLFDGHYSNGQLDGRVTQWINDVMRKRCSYRKGHEIGKYEEWSNTGHLLKVANYILSADGENTVLDGPYSQWNENGILQMKGTYSKGMRTGTWTFWDDSGLLTEKWVYENDERVKFITGSPAVLAERAKKAEEERLAAERVKWAGTGTYGRMLGLTVDNPILSSLTERPELQTSAGKAALNAVLQTEYFNFPASVQVEQQYMISDTVQWLQEDGSRLHLVRYAVKQTYSASNAFGVRSLATLWTCVAVAADTAKLVSISEPMDFGGSGNDAFTKETFKLFNWTIHRASPVSESFLVTFGSMFASVVVTPQYKYLGLAYNILPNLANAASNFALQYIRTCPGILGFLAEKAP